MVKTILPSSWDSIADQCAHLFYDTTGFTKSAGTIFGLDYDSFKPDKDHVGIHLIGLGDYEHFGLNRNFDGFTKKSCQEFYPTFMEYGNLFEHHRNKDPDKRIGQIKAAAYNEPMGRLELIVHAHKEKAAKHLEKYEKTGEACFSMACKVDYDECNVCGAHRKNRKDWETCDHLKYQFGKEAEDGTIIGTLNPEPRWFDMSFVDNPADRIAYDLKKVASEAGKTEFFQKWAEDLESGLTVPAYVLMDTDLARVKLACLNKLVAMEKELVSSTGGVSYRRTLELLKEAGANSGISDGDIDALRRLSPDAVFTKLANAGVVMCPDSFLRYVFGNDYGAVNDYAQAVVAKCAEASGEAAVSPLNVCTSTRYDTNGNIKNVPEQLIASVQKSASCVGEPLKNRIILSESIGIQQNKLDKMASNAVMYASSIAALAEEYTSYKVAALSSITQNLNPKEQDSVYAVAAAQNLYRSKT